jgi:hypothetical protein
MPNGTVDSPVNRLRVRTPMANSGRPTSPGARSNPSNGKYDPTPGNRPLTAECRSLRPGSPTIRET